MFYRVFLCNYHTLVRQSNVIHSLICTLACSSLERKHTCYSVYSEICLLWTPWIQPKCPYYQGNLIPGLISDWASFDTLTHYADYGFSIFNCSQEQVSLYLGFTYTCVFKAIET